MTRGDRGMSRDVARDRVRGKGGPGGGERALRPFPPPPGGDQHPGPPTSPAGGGEFAGQVGTPCAPYHLLVCSRVGSKRFSRTFCSAG